MATITAIEPQKRNPNRVNIQLDGQFAFGLSRVTAAWLSVGQSLTEEKITALQQADASEGALQQALLFLGTRPRSVSEVRKNLEKHEFAPTVVDATVERLEADGLLGDQQFAATWVENRNTFRPRGRRALALELRQKGISDDAIRRALESIPGELSLALLAGRKYVRRLNGLEWTQFRAKLGGHLSRRGFPYEVVSAAVKHIWQEMDQDLSSETEPFEDMP
jgi:regulatory protein